MIKIGNLLVIALAFYSTSAFSNENITKGIRSISGTISYDRYKNSSASEPTTRFEISPKFLYFVTDSLGAGAILGYSQDKNSIYDRDGYGVGPYFRYYFPIDNLLPYVSLGYMYSKAKFSGESIRNDEYTSKEKSAAVGVNYFIATHVAVEAELKYTSGDRKIEYEAGFSLPAQTYKSSYYNFNFGVGVNVFF